MTVTSAAATANNTITNKVYITLSELGATDMVQDNTVNCQYKSGSGTNTLTFRGRLNTTDAGYLGFTDGFIHVNGTATMQSDDETFSGILSETDGGQSDDSIVLDAITVADNINLLFSADAGEGIEQNSISMELEGADGATSVIGTQSMRTGFGVDTLDGRVSMLEDGSGKLINETDGTDGFAAEEFTVDAEGLILATQSGSASGSATILNGVTTA